MTKNSVMRATYTSAIYLITAMFAVILFTLGPRLEVVINPVISVFEINRSWNNDRTYFIEGVMLKSRGECQPTGIFMLAYGGVTDSNAKYIRVDFSPDPGQYGDEIRIRPAGAQHWGPWQIIPPVEPIGPIVSIVVTHRCHALWELTQTVYTGLTTDIFPGLIIDQENPNGG